MKNLDGFSSAPQEDLHDMQIVSAILEEGDPKRLEQVAQALNENIETVLLACQFAKLRRGVITQMRKEIAGRIRSNPEPTQEELNAGLYREELEPQVRDSVFELRMKGYQTYSSGFGGWIGQHVVFKDPVDFKGFEFSDSLKKWVSEHGGAIQLTDEGVTINFKQFVDLGTLSQIWKRISAEMPQVGPAAAPSEMIGAIEFRKRHQAE